jgi:transcriptional regulator with XRE-family HTH domain
MNYGKAIRVTRALADVSQRELARKLNTDPSYISLLEANKREPSRELLEKIAEVFEVPLHLLILMATDSIDSGQSESARLSTIAETLAKLMFADEGSDGQPRKRNRTVKARQPHKARPKTSDKPGAAGGTSGKRSAAL